MAQKPQIKYAIHKSAETGRFLLSFDNLTKAEAAEYLLLLARQQDARAEPVVDEGKLVADVERREVIGLVIGLAERALHGAPAGEGFKGATTDEVAAALGIDPFPKTAGPCFGPRLVTKLAHFDHKYEPGAFGVCKRCGGEKH